MNRNSQNRQYPQNFSGYLNQHQQPIFNQPPSGEGSGIYRQPSFNGRVVQNQGQGAPLNSAPVPGAPAARFDGNLPFHSGQGTQQWIPPTMIPQHNIAVPPGQHGIPPPRPVVAYSQQIQSSQHWPQNPTSYVPYPMAATTIPRMQGVQTTPQPPPPYQSSLQQQYPQSHPQMQIPPNQHMQHLTQPQMTQQQRHVQTLNTTQAMIPGTQATSYPSANIHHGVYTTAPAQQSTTIQKRVPKPLIIVDPKTNQPVDLKETSGKSDGSPAPSGPLQSSLSSEKEDTPETHESTASSSSESKPVQNEAGAADAGATLNAAAQEFFPHADAPQEPCISDTPEVDVEKVEGAKKDEKVITTNTEAAPVTIEPSSLNHETKSDSGDTNTPLTTPEVTDLDEPEKSSDVPAADETVSEEAANPELKEIDEEVIQETENVESNMEKSDDRDVANGDAVCEQSDNDILSQDDSASDTCTSPPVYNFKVDTTEAPAMTENRKRHYDRNYLINLQRCKAALRQPTGLPEELIEQGVILKTASPLDLTKPLPALKSKGMDDFTPEYARNMQAYRAGSRFRGDGQRAGQVGGSGGRYSNSAGGQRRGSQQTTRRIEPVRREQVKIHTSENAYIPAVLQKYRPKPPEKDDETEEERIEKEKAKRRRICFSHLNKLTPQNSDVIFDHIRESGILCDGEGIDEIAGCIFKKAVTEPPYSVALADLVAKIMSEYDSDEMQKHKTFFKQNLLSRCQTMFETELEKQVNDESERMRLKMEDEKDPKIKAMLNEEVEEAKKKVRAKYYGNIKFVGELYLRGLVGAKTIHDCVAMLLQHKTEESIESVCKFLETTGAKLDQGQATSRVDHYFNRIVKIKDKIDNQRLKFKLADLIDMRSRGWKLRERAAEFQVRPRTRAELEKERIEEEHKKQVAVDKMVARKREEGRYGGRGGNFGGRPSAGAVGGPGGGGGGGRRSLMQDNASAPVQGNPDGWKTVPSRRVDPRSLAIMKEKDDGDVKLGPGAGLSKWTQGCRTKGREGGDRVSATKNMGRQNLSPSPRNSANSSRRGSNSNIPASVVAAAMSQRDSSSQSREEIENTRNGVPGAGESVGASSGEINERPPLDLKMRDLVENKCKHIFSEYTAHREFDLNAFESIKLYGDAFVESLIAHVIELSKVGRIEAGHMVYMMLQRAYIRTEDIADGFKPHFECASEILVDVPKFYTYVAEILSGMLCDEVMCALPKIMEPLDRSPEVSTVIAEMLHLASGENGHDKIGVMFRSASLDWHIFLNEAKTKLDDFIKTNKLEFTLTGGVPKVPDSCVNLIDLERELHDLVSQSNLNKEDVFSLLETSVDKRTASSKEFVNMVVRTIAGVAVKTADFEFLHNLCPVLRHIICECTDQKKQHELMVQALYAIQRIAIEAQNPSQSINAVFDILSDGKVISDNAFLDYYHMKEPEVIDGYELTVRSAANFYATLMST